MSWPPHKGSLHLSKGWARGRSRPSHLLISRPVNLLPWLSGPTRPGVWRPPRLWYQELLSKKFVMRQAGPHRTHSSDFILGPGLYPRFQSALVLVLLVRFTQDRHSSLWWCCTDVPIACFTQRSSLEREHSVTTVTSVPWKGNERCVPGHISFVPVSGLLRLLS